MFVTLTCPSYGRVDHRGVPVDPASYDYDRAARDALSFAALFDRFIQNLRRYLGHDVQYFAAVEPQRRLAPHIHIAIRGTIARAELRQVLAATYHQVWWPDTASGTTTATCCLSGTTRLAGMSTRPLGRCSRPGMSRWMPSVPTTCRGTWPGSGTGSTPRACWPDPRGRPVHRLPDQIPHQARRRLPPGHHRTSSTTTPPGWPRRCGISRARRGARTGSATASSPRTPGLAWPPAPARARLTTPITWAMPGGGCWSPASGPARPWPTTAPTARNGCCAPSLFRQPTRPGTPGSPSPPLTRISWTTPGGCCTSSPTGSDGKPHSPRPGDGPPCHQTVIFRQPGGQHEWGRRVIELLTIEEVAERLRVSVPTVRWLRQEGRFVPAIKIGRRLMWDTRDVAAWLKAQRETPKVA